MKAISIRAPWWWFILHGGKDVENRDWSTRYRGPVLIHASSWFRSLEIADDLATVRRTIIGNAAPGPSLSDLRALGGHLVGRALIVDCVDESDSPWFFGPHGFVLADVVPLAQPVPCKGALGFFEAPSP